MGNGRKKYVHKKEADKIVSAPSEWLYFAMEGVSLRSIYDCLKKQKRWGAEYWEEAEVLEISISENGFVDLESMEMDPEDGELYACMEETGAKTVYAVTIVPEHFEKMQDVMRYIAEEQGGVFRGDTADFLPEVKAVSGLTASR